MFPFTCNWLSLHFSCGRLVDICAYTCLHNRIRLFHEPKYHPTSTNTSLKDHETGAMGSHSAITEQGSHWYRHFWWPSAWKALKSYPMKWNMLTSLRAKDRLAGYRFSFRGGGGCWCKESNQDLGLHMSTFFLRKGEDWRGFFVIEAYRMILTNDSKCVWMLGNHGLSNGSVV